MTPARLVEIIHSLQCRWDAGHRSGSDSYIRELCQAIRELQDDNAKPQKLIEDRPSQGEWHSKVDKHGNVTCNKCMKIQSHHFKACIYCCPHDALDFNEEWYALGWSLAFSCRCCGTNLDFKYDVLVKNYKVVKK